MAVMTEQKSRIRLRSIALPAEHGGWGFLFEPIVLGLILAPTTLGILFAFAALGMFLVHQPLKITIKDYHKGRRTLRTQWAERFVVMYGGVAIISFLFVLYKAEPQFLIPLLIALPFAIVQTYYDAQNRSRHIIAETSGTIAIAAIAPALLLIGDWALDKALIIWLVVLGRNIPSILYVRVRLRLERSQEPSLVPAWLSHMVALGVIVGLIGMGYVPWGALIAILILTTRALWGISQYRKPIKPVQVGIGEIIFGLLYVIIIGVAYAIK